MVVGFRGQCFSGFDLEYTALGVVFPKADAMCEYVTILAKTTEEAKVRNSQTAGAAWMRYAQVTPIFGSQKPFAVEGVTPIAKVLQFDMSDGERPFIAGLALVYHESVMYPAGMHQAPCN